MVGVRSAATTWIFLEEIGFSSKVGTFVTTGGQQPVELDQITDVSIGKVFRGQDYILAR